MKRLFLLLALCGMVAVGCTEGGFDDNIDNGGNNTEQPGEDDDDENKEDETTFITDSKGNVVVEAEGGEVVVTVTTDIEYSVEIPKEAQSWLSVADTRAIRMEKLTFTVADNDTFEERSANVELVDSDGKSLQTIKFLQRASDKVFEIDDEGKYIIEAQGGVIEVDVTTNIEYNVVIPDDAQQWISVADTRAIRKEKLTFTVADNDTFEERSADVELVDSKGKSLQTINFTQLAKSNVMANNEIWYTTTDNKRVIPPSTEPTVFGAYFISNTYSDGKGVLTFDGEITKIGNGAFKDIGNLASITIPDSVTSIGSNAFYGCSNLTSITIPDSVKSIGSEAFRNCTSLTCVTIGKGVTSIGKNAFSGCTGELIVNCNIPSASTSEYGAFYGSKFTQVTIGNGVTSIGSYAFEECTSLTSITIGKGITEIGKNAFSGCTGELIVNCNIPSASTSEYGAFYGSKFTQVTIGNGVTSIGSYAFYRFSLTSITIPDSVTSIGNSAFRNCDSLTSITIPDSVTSIGDDAFIDCY